MPQIELPAGTHYALTVAIPENYRGLTASMLQRSRSFVKYAGVDVTILTLMPLSDYDVVRERLRSTGAMIDGMHLLNIWEDVATWDDARLSEAVSMSPPPTPVAPLGERGDRVLRIQQTLLDENGEHVQSDYLRPDGSLLLSDHVNPSTGGRAYTLFNNAGEALCTWADLSTFHHFWLDNLPRDPIAWIVVESKHVAATLQGYHRSDVAFMHVIRGSHVQPGPGGPLVDPLVERRRPVMENLGLWDSVIFLADRQRQDVIARFGEHDNLDVVPDDRSVPASVRNFRRDRDRGIILAGLVSRKRVGHAVRAMAKVKARLPKRRVHLDVWGQGPMEPSIRALIAKLEAPVTLHGHSSEAPEEFETASFSLLTSRTEGLPGVILEAMGSGCVPISYDCPYGPADIITHGVDGFIVPFGDTEALADRIVEVATMPHRKLKKMRKAGHRRAMDFNDVNVMKQWKALFEKIARRRGWS